MLLGGLLATMYIFRVLNLAFVKEEGAETTASTPANSRSPAEPAMAVCGFVLALLAMASGFNAGWILGLLADNPTVTAAEALWN